MMMRRRRSGNDRFKRRRRRIYSLEIVQSLSTLRLPPTTLQISKLVFPRSCQLASSLRPGSPSSKRNFSSSPRNIVKPRYPLPNSKKSSRSLVDRMKSNKVVWRRLKVHSKISNNDKVRFRLNEMISSKLSTPSVKISSSSKLPRPSRRNRSQSSRSLSPKRLRNSISLSNVSTPSKIHWTIFRLPQTQRRRVLRPKFKLSNSSSPRSKNV